MGKVVSRLLHKPAFRQLIRKHGAVVSRITSLWVIVGDLAKVEARVRDLGLGVVQVLSPE